MTRPDAADAATVLRLDSVAKRFGGVVAVDDLSIEVREGELLAVVGPSGCGKSTLLRLVAGLTTPDAGRVVLAGRTVAGSGAWVPPERRGVGVVFQDYALFPHITVAGNVAFGLDGRQVRRTERVREMLHRVGLAPLADRYPHELSGGEAQRVALARSLAPRPSVVLLDEPFSNLDRNMRTRVREDTVSVLRDAGASGVLVTHDQEEALAVGDRVAVLRDGRLEQLATPEVVFHAPANRFVATLMGEADFVAGTQTGTTAVTRLGRVPAAGGSDEPVDVEVMLRPHEITLTEDAAGDGVVRRTEFRGASIAYYVEVGDGTVVRSLCPHTRAIAVGTRVRVHLDPGHRVATFPAAQPSAAAEDDAGDVTIEAGADAHAT